MASKAKKSETICVVGLGYVGLPLALAFDKAGLRVIGFDVKQSRIEELQGGKDAMGEADAGALRKARIFFTNGASQIKSADFVLVCVPTPITWDKKPELAPIESASKTVGQNLKKGAIVVFESTVWPGLTEEICVPLIEKESGLKCGKDWFVAYSPERINPGDKKHSIGSVVKVVAGMDAATTKKVAALYKKICKAGVFVAANIKTAEAAKVIENIQRDLNIALMNELSIIFSRLGIETKEVLAAASTKWNFGNYKPGLVGGHCIPVDPYYLTEKVKSLGYEPKVILAGRELNDSMPKFVCSLAEKGLRAAEKQLKGAKIMLLGLTFKENVKDTRESQAEKIVELLSSLGAEVFACDPLLSAGEIEKDFKAKPIALKDFDGQGFDCIVVSAAHDEFRKLDLEKLKKTMNERPVLVDARWLFNGKEAEAAGFLYYSL
jgi:UDP-N-acetyl-D-galactosamine dehydrogenase